MNVVFTEYLFKTPETASGGKDALLVPPFGEIYGIHENTSNVLNCVFLQNSHVNSLTPRIPDYDYI